MGSAADALNVSRSFLGIVENPDGSNRTPIGAEYGWNGVAWCDEAVSVVLRRIGLAPGPLDSAHFASCWFHVQAYKRGECGTWLGNPGPAGLRPGDQGFLGTVGQDHTFLVEAVDGADVVTLEGNLRNGHRRARRRISSVYGFGRPNYETGVVPGLPPPSATEGRAILRLGVHGDAVRQWQVLLVGAGYDLGPGGIDGAFGPKTDTATRAFQAKLGVTADGEVGPATYAAVDRLIAWLTALNAPPAPGVAPPFPGTVREGSRNHPAVMLVQDRLRVRGWRIRVDGIFGPSTRTVVEAFQREKRLTPDGVAGPATWVALWTAPRT